LCISDVAAYKHEASIASHTWDNSIPDSTEKSAILHNTYN